MLFRPSSSFLLLLLQTFQLWRSQVLCQIPAKSYPVKTGIHPNSTIPQGAWGMDIDITPIENAPRFDLSLWSTISFPMVLTPCAYMYPLVISVKNLNYIFESSPVSFSCNHAGLTGPVWISTAFGSISVNQTSSYYTACNMLVDHLNLFEPSMIQTSSSTNFTFLLPGTLVAEALSTIVKDGAPPTSTPDPTLTWLQQHYYSEIWVNLATLFNLATSFTDMVVLPLKYKIELPHSVLPGKVIQGSTPAEHSYVDLFNLTLSRGSFDPEVPSPLWRPKRYFSGFQPSVVNSAQGTFIPIQNNVTNDEYNSAVPFGWTNIALGVSPIRVVMPSNLPSQMNSSCVSNYLFYYPMDSHWTSTNKSDPFNLSLLRESSLRDSFMKVSKRDSSISRNTILASHYFSKRPFLNGVNYPGQLQDTISTYLTFANNFIGGCYYNGTFPYTPKGSYLGIHADVGLCGQHLRNATTQFKSPFYLPPIEYISGPSPVSYFFILTSLVQHVSYSHKGSFRSDLSDETRIFRGAYPGNGLLHSLLLATAVNQPFIFFSIPSFVNHDTSITLGSNFYQFSERYMNRNFGQYGVPGSGMTCRAARFVPMKRDMFSLKTAWQCKTQKTPSSSSWKTMVNIPREEITSCKLNNEFVSCLTAADSQAQFIGMINTSPYEHITTLKGSSFKTDSYLAITLTMFTDTMYYTSPNKGISVKLFSPPISGFNSPEYCIKPPMIPSVPTTVQQVFIIFPTMKPWNHIHNTKYSFLIPFNKSFSIRHKVTLGKTTGVDSTKKFYITANLHCESLRRISGTPSITRISISDVVNSGDPDMRN